MYEVFLPFVGAYTHSKYDTLDAAVAAARKIGYVCHIYRKGNPFKIVKTVGPLCS